VTLAAALEVSEATARRRFVTSMDAILEKFGGELLISEASSAVPACLRCGERPRARIVTFGPKAKGKARSRHERQSALCCVCLEAAAERTGAEPPEITTLITTTLIETETMEAAA
jgi:hypothetical protein